jgi:AcrR family transcriptional regulator
MPPPKMRPSSGRTPDRAETRNPVTLPAVTRPTLKAQQSERTKAALVAAGRRLFAMHGYAGVSAEEVASAAGVTTGAVYHQFQSKRGLFVAVFEAVEEDVTARVAAAATSEKDPWEGFQAACLAFLASAAEADVRQVLLIDGRAVLGWDEWHGIMARYGLGMTRAAVDGLMRAGMLPTLPLDALTAVLFGALNEAATFVASAEDPAAARAEMAKALGGVLAALKNA